MTDHPVVAREEWLVARKQLLAREKELTKLRDAESEARRDLPWVRVEKDYRFRAESGPVTLGELFDGRSQLIVYHFMFGPGWKEGCPGCSFLADHFDSVRLHILHHDVSLTVVSRAPLDELLPFKKRMGWRFPWVSAAESDFNYDFAVSFTPEDRASGKPLYNFGTQPADNDELPGVSVFARDEAGAVFHTYSSYGRGAEMLLGTYGFLDITPKGRNENGPNFNLGDWVRHHDRYADSSGAPCCCS